MEKDNKGRALYFHNYFEGHYIKMNHYKYVVAHVNKYNSLSDFRVIILDEFGYILYDSNKHSNLTFEEREEAWEFINEKILTKAFDYYADVEKYKRSEYEKEAAIEKERHNKNVANAELLNAALNKYNLNIYELIELIKLYDEVNYKYLYSHCGYKGEDNND